MIQRRQSVWLLLATILVLLTFKLPTYTGITDPLTKQMQELKGGDTVLLILLTILVATLAVVSAISFKNRTTQIRLCGLGMLAQVGLIITYVLLSNKFSSGNFSIFSIFHGIVGLLFMLAINDIKKDQKMLANADRLR
jgi:hypothetical protein